MRANWINQCIELCQPRDVFWCDGSAEEKPDAAEAPGSEGRVLIELNQEKLPGCYLHRSNPNDVARSEQATFICTPGQDMAGPTNNWMETRAAYAKLKGLFSGCMKGRTMYVVPFVMGPIGSTLAKVGEELTDSVYVAVSMGIMTRMGTVAWKQLDAGAQADDPNAEPEFTRCLHSLGDCNPERRYICHFPLDNTIWSFGSGYGGNALLGKKCMALRIASFLGEQQDWMAEHMLLMGVTSPQGEKTYIAGAFPSACGKTNFAMLIPPKKYQDAGWRITTVGDDIVWMWVDDAGKLRAINPESGYFGVVPGTNEQTNPNAMAAMSRDTIYTNVATLLTDGDVWWEWEKLKRRRKSASTGWARNGHPVPGGRRRRPNGRFTAPMTNNPPLDAAAERSGAAFSYRRLFSAAAAPVLFRSSIRRSTGFTAFTWAQPSAAKPRQPRAVKSASSAVTQWPCSPSLATTSAIILSIGSACASACPIAPEFSTSTGSERDEATEISLARIRRKHARVEMDHRPLARAGVRARDADGMDATEQGYRSGGIGYSADAD